MRLQYVKIPFFPEHIAFCLTNVFKDISDATSHCILKKLAPFSFNKVLLQLNERKCVYRLFLPQQMRLRHHELDFRDICKIRHVTENKKEK